MKKLTTEELNRIDIECFKKTEKSPFVLVLDNIRSLNNVGSMFRSSDAFLIRKILLCGITACPPHKDIHKTALGATESVDWEYYETTEQALKSLKQQGYCCVALEQTENSIELQDFVVEPQQNYAIVVGHEVKGVQQSVVDMCDHALEIPQFGTKHSFNVSVATGMVLWDLFSKYKFQK